MGHGDFGLPVTMAARSRSTRAMPMSTLPPCPQCQSEYTYEDGAQLVCPECGHEWSAEAPIVADEGPRVVKDANGNVLQDGDVIESRFAVERRNRTIHKRMREYLFELTHNEGLLTSVVPLGDGIAITMKSHEKREETT